MQRLVLLSFFAIGLAVHIGCNAKTMSAVEKALQKESGAAKQGSKALERKAAASRGLSRSASGLSRLAARSGTLLQRSERAGQRIVNARSRMPPDVYGRLFYAWQHTHGAIQAYHQELQNPSLSPSYRQQIEDSLATAETQLAEIERLTAQYG
jgi:hypothetical protein